MAEEQAEAAVETAEAPAVEAEAPAQDDKGQPEGREFIDFDGLAPPVRERINYMYGKSQQDKRVIQEMGKVNRQVIERLHKLENNAISNTNQQAIRGLNAQKAAALDEGDSARVVDIDNRIRAIENQPPAQAPQVVMPDPEPAVNPADEAAMATWAQETDDQGSLKRPWADPGHPMHTKAATLGAAAMEDPNLYTMQDRLAEIDRLMGVTPPVARNAAPVLSSGDGARRSGGEKSGLTADEKAIVRAMYPEVSREEGEKRYLKSKEALAK